MASNAYIKSLLWLVSLGGIGYGLLLFTEPSQEKLEKIKASASRPHSIEDEKKKLLFTKLLKEPATEVPIYIKKKDN